MKNESNQNWNENEKIQHQGQMSSQGTNERKSSYTNNLDSQTMNNINNSYEGFKANPNYDYSQEHMNSIQSNTNIPSQQGQQGEKFNQNHIKQQPEVKPTDKMR